MLVDTQPATYQHAPASPEVRDAWVNSQLIGVLMDNVGPTVAAAAVAVPVLVMIGRECLPAGAADDEGDVRAFFVEELLAAGVADPVVGHEDDQRVRQLAFLLEAGEHSSDMGVGQADGVEVVGPILQQHRIARVVGRQGDLRGVRAGAEFADDALAELDAAGLGAFT